MYADSSRRQNKRVGNYVVIYAKENQLGSREGALPPPQNFFSILSLKMATFSAFRALFLQFIVRSSMDCLKRFRRQKPLLVEKLAVVCMQIALGDKTSVLETTL